MLHSQIHLPSPSYPYIHLQCLVIDYGTSHHQTLNLSKLVLRSSKNINEYLHRLVSCLRHRDNGQFTCYKLKWSCRNLLTCTSDTNNTTHSPSLRTEHMSQNSQIAPILSRPSNIPCDKLQVLVA